MNVIDRIRVERAIRSYDWWLELRGAGGRQRRALRHELRTNLHEAAEHQGARSAVESLGRTRLMAADAIPVDRTRPRWSAGLQAAVIASALTLMAVFFAGLAWADGVLAAEPGHDVVGSLTFAPGSEVEYTILDDGFGVAMSPGWSPLAVGLVVLVLVARPWRLLSRRTREPVTA